MDAFVAWLEQNGWTTDTEVNFVDVCARRGDERLYAEAKGRTMTIGLAAAIPAALRVPAWVRQRLDIDVYEVDDAGRVHPRQ